MEQRSISDLIAAVTGLIVWAAHFTALYGMQTAFCILSHASWSTIDLQIAGVALTSIAAGALLVLAGRPTAKARGDSDANENQSARFLRKVSMVTAVLALLAVLWATLPLLLLSACGPAAA